MFFFSEYLNLKIYQLEHSILNLLGLNIREEDEKTVRNLTIKEPQNDKNFILIYLFGQQKLIKFLSFFLSKKKKDLFKN